MHRLHVARDGKQTANLNLTIDAGEENQKNESMAGDAIEEVIETTEAFTSLRRTQGVEGGWEGGREGNATDGTMRNTFSCA